jgi:four helix bundle protein
MDAPHTHRDLLAWQQAIALAEMVYRVTARFPGQEVYGLVSQLRRAAISVPSNIAEGAARNSPRELFQFLGISCGSVAEMETQLELAVRLGYLESDANVINQCSRVGLLLRNLRKSIKVRVATRV